jgi:hypothetical protein
MHDNKRRYSDLRQLDKQQGDPNKSKGTPENHGGKPAKGPEDAAGSMEHQPEGNPWTVGNGEE